MHDLLRGVTVLECAMFAPDALGGHLADLGADVIKVEPPGGAGFRGPMAPHGHLQDVRWNRGKKSVTIDLKAPEGQELFRRLAAKADVVIDGYRRGTAERLGYGYDDIVSVNPKIIYCVINGMGNTGPYADLGTHGLSFDCFAGLTPPVIAEDGSARLPPQSAAQAGVVTGPLYGALAVCAALHAVARDGKSRYLEVSQVDAAIVYNFERVTALASGLPYDDRGIQDSLRYQYYETADGHYVVFNALEDKFWRRFCEGVNREDLYEAGKANPLDDPEATKKLRHEITEIFRSRSRSEWTHFFIENNIAGAPAFLGGDLFEDPHVVARKLFYEQPDGDGVLRMLQSPIHASSADAAPPAAAPSVGADTDDVLRSMLGCDGAELERLRADGVV